MSSNWPLKGWTITTPNGSIIRMFCSTKEEAKSEAAFHNRPNTTNTIVMPRDWKRAKKAGYRLVKVNMNPIRVQ